MDGGDTAAYVLSLGGPRTLLSVLERSAQPMGEATAALILEDVAAALEYLHANRVLHRDMKPDNILLSPCAPASVQTRSRGARQQYRAVLADMGFAVRLPPPPAARAAASAFAAGSLSFNRTTRAAAPVLEDAAPPPWMAHSLIGSALYLAPEIALTLMWDEYSSRFVPDPARGYDSSCDIWALGVVLYKALTQQDVHPAGEGIKFKALHE